MAKSAVIAFSGGLDTSFLVPFAREKYGFTKIITCTVNTGGFSDEEKEKIARRSQEVGADEHIFISAEEEFYSSVLRFMIYGNVTRDGYPLSVGTERMIQAQKVVGVAKDRGCDCVLHGSTGAGNDQYRFDVAVQVYGKGTLSCITPIREFNISRDFSTSYLKEKGISVPEKNTRYSYNAGLWGVSIGGAETHSSSQLIPDTAWYSKPEPGVLDEILTLHFTKGEITRLESSLGSIKYPVDIIQAITHICNRYGIGRHYHVGTSVPGKKGRLAYESPAADVIYEAHRTLEKITLSQAQISGKRFMSDEYGRLVHEAKFFDPYLKDIEALLESSQRRVTGKTMITLSQGIIKAVTADSPYNLLAAKGAQYGEVSEYYDGRDAAGATKLHGFEQYVYHSFDD